MEEARSSFFASIPRGEGSNTEHEVFLFRRVTKGYCWKRNRPDFFRAQKAGDQFFDETVQ